MSAWQIAILGGAVGVLIDRSGRRLAQIATALRDQRARQASDLDDAREAVLDQVREGVVDTVRRRIHGDQSGAEASQ